MTKRLTLIAIAAGLSGCFLTYDPDSVPAATTGATACSAPGSVCRAQSCTGSTLSYAAYCTGGTCTASATLDCAPYVCGGTGCKTGCGGDGDCTPANYCVSSSCVPKLAGGQVCGAASECASGFCSPDGRCCDRACTGACESCNGANTGAPAGTCAAVVDGAPPDPTHSQCTPYAFCSGGACRAACADSSECTTGNYCGPTGTCDARKPDGAACTTAMECQHGQCADGVCCDTACGGCKACNVAGKVGKCSNVPLGQDPHGACSKTSCQAACNGAGGCSTAITGQICASNSCVQGAPDVFGRPTSATATIAFCSGTTQSCATPSSPGSWCALHACDGGQCNLTCLDNSDCISGAVCLSGTCSQCASDADCGPYAPFCDTGQGVCTCPGDPSCADAQCGSSLDCEYAGFGSVCLVPWDVCQCTTGDACNGRAPRCGGAPGLCTCGAGIGTLCPVGQVCTNATTSGACKISPGFPCTAAPSDCASGVCAGGMCTKLVAGKPCAHASDCATGVCGPGWTCG